MPKATDPDVLIRAALLLGSGMRARAVARELKGQISATRVRELAKTHGVELPAGRPEGIEQPRPATSERRLLAREMALYEEPRLTFAEIGELLDCSRARAHKLATDDR